MSLMYGGVKLVVIISVGSLLFAGILVGSYGIWSSLGYKTWNDQAIPTYARIEAIEVVNTTCSYKCNRYCIANCAYCNNDCSDVFLNISYNRHHQHYQYLSNVTNYTTLLTQLKDCCTVGRYIRIYYNKDNPHDVTTELHSVVIFWLVIFFTLALTVGCIIFVIILYRRETAVFDYQRLYDDPSITEPVDSLDFFNSSDVAGSIDYNNKIKVVNM